MFFANINFNLSGTVSGNNVPKPSDIVGTLANVLEAISCTLSIG